MLIELRSPCSEVEKLQIKNNVRNKKVEEEGRQGIALMEAHICGEGLAEFGSYFDTGC